MNYGPAQLKHVWYYPIPGCVLLGVYESLISSDWFSPSLSSLLFTSLSVFLSPLSLLPSPIPCHTPVPRGVCLGSARLISGVEEKANWEPVLAVNLIREGGEPAVATLPLQPSTSSSPPVHWHPLTCINMCRHTHMHTHTQDNKAVCTLVFRCSLTSKLT